ncbi:GNAT family N-acetyltransferase [Bradyrhizobium sp. RDT10]
MMTYWTERLILTSMRPEHEAELLKLHKDPLVREMIFNNVPQTSDDVRKSLDRALAQWQKNGFGWWMIYEKADDGPIFIGRCGLWDYEDTNNLEIGNMLCEHGRGRGLGTEAARFAVTHALRNSSKEKVVSVIAHGNARSQRGAKKLGLRYIDDRLDKREGRIKQYYEMSREEYFFQPHHQISE